MKKLALLLPLAVACALPAATVNHPAELAHSVTIYRDTYGVPHIFGPTDASCVFGYAYAQAEDNFWQIEDSYLRALGRASEVYGKETLDDDLVIRTLEIPRLAKAEYERTAAPIRDLLDAFAQGLNYYIERHPRVHPRLLSHFEPWYMLAFNRYALYYLFLYGETGIPKEDTGKMAESQGSNMWAIRPSKSATGHAMLFINPHQPFFGPGQWYEGHVHSQSGWDMSGASFFGSAFPTIGHNEHLGWSHTVNKPDVFDVWQETFDKPGDPLAYRYDGGYRQATAWTDSIAVKTDQGPINRTYKMMKTHHGPVVAQRDGKSLSVRFARFEEGGQIEEWYRMSKSRNLAEFRAAMSPLAVPMFNAMYADDAGNIFYLYNGAVPRRSTKFDWSKPVDGSTSETEWHGFHSIDELPQVLNPKSGYVQNCNSTPFATTFEGNPDPGEYPKYMVGEGDTARAQISRRILWNKEKFTFEEWSRAAFDTYVIEAETEIPRLAGLWEALRQSDAARAGKLARPIAELRAWDHIGRESSVPMTLFCLWFWPNRTLSARWKESCRIWRRISAPGKWPGARSTACNALNRVAMSLSAMRGKACRWPAVRALWVSSSISMRAPRKARRSASAWPAIPSSAFWTSGRRCRLNPYWCSARAPTRRRRTISTRPGFTPGSSSSRRGSTCRTYRPTPSGRIIPENNRGHKRALKPRVWLRWRVRRAVTFGRIPAIRSSSRSILTWSNGWAQRSNRGWEPDSAALRSAGF